METKMRGCGIQAMQANKILFNQYISKLLLNKIWENEKKKKQK